jgi:predicted transcriptional regulator
MRKGGAFCEIYGISIHNLVLEYLLENRDLDFATGDLAKNTKISRPKAYETIKSFEKKAIVKKSRIIAKTQLYILNKSNDKVKLFLKDFNECLRLVVENEKPALARHSSGVGIAYAKQA